MANDIATQLRHLEVSMRLSGGQWMLPAWDGHRVATLLEKAQASLLAKEADTDRLDWMDKNPGRIKHSIGYRDSRDSWVWTDANGYGHDAVNLRAAIDAARAAADQGGA